MESPNWSFSEYIDPKTKGAFSYKEASSVHRTLRIPSLMHHFFTFIEYNQEANNLSKQACRREPSSMQIKISTKEWK
jgi:hypothetical protein